MANIVELKELIKSTLNSNATDPYDTNSARPGGLPQQFFTESDGLNLSRGNTFPKGYITVGSSPKPVKDNVGRTGYIKYYATVNIFYYVKEKNNYTTGGITYKNEDIIHFMLKDIQTTLLNNRISGYHLFPDSFGDSSDIVIDATVSEFKLYRGVLPVTFYWFETYG